MVKTGQVKRIGEETLAKEEIEFYNAEILFAKGTLNWAVSQNDQSAITHWSKRLKLLRGRLSDYLQSLEEEEGAASLAEILLKVKSQ